MARMFVARNTGIDMKDSYKIFTMCSVYVSWCRGRPPPRHQVLFKSIRHSIKPLPRVGQAPSIIITYKIVILNFSTGKSCLAQLRPQGPSTGRIHGLSWREGQFQHQ